MLAGDVVFVSSDTGGNVNGIQFDDEDILAYEQSSGTWSKYFDGSQVGLSTRDLDAFHVNQNDGTILMSVETATTSIPGLGRVEDSDVIRFTPSQLGPGTSGTFDFYLDGSDVGLAPTSEDIDAIALDDSGNLIISTVGNYILPSTSGNISGSSADLLVFNGNTGSDNNTGTWSTYLDGSDIGLGATENVQGAGVQVIGPMTLVQFTTKGSFSVPGLNGDFNDIVEVDVNTLGDNTTANSITQAFDVGSLGLPAENLDGMQLGDFVGNEVFQGFDFYFSSDGNGSLGGTSFNDDDILKFDSSLGAYELIFDGSDVGLTNDVDAFIIESDTSILLSLRTSQALPGIPGTVDDSDVVRFSGLLGDTTAGSFTMVFDGSDVGLDSFYENVDGIAIDPVTGNLVLSTTGNYTVPGSSGAVSGDNRDILIFADTLFGDTTAGTFSQFLDGASVGLSSSSEDITGIWIDPLGLDTFINTKGSYAVPGLSGGRSDIFAPSVPLLLYDGQANGTGNILVDGIHVAAQNSPPEIISDGGGDTASLNADENQIFVTDVQSIDAEGDIEGAGLSYSITGGADASLFTVSTSTGVVTFLAAPDFENPADFDNDGTYEVEVTVTDSGGLTDAQDLSVTIDDINDNPVITSDGGGATANVDAAENQTAVTTVTATDEDLPAHTLTFTITGGADQALFGITPGGVLTFNAAPDFENPTDTGGNGVYDVEVTVTDNGIPNLTDVQDIAVTVTDANENPVIISDGGGATASVNAAENQTFVTDVQTVDDGNSEGAGLTYTISGGADAGLFSIGTLSGVVTFNTAPDFDNPTDAGANGIYDVQVTVTDSGAPNLTDVQDIAVTVTDLNENPVITSDGGGATANIDVNENTTAVTTVTATDPDIPAQTLTFTISGGADQTLFGITPGGVLTFNAAPDFENPTDFGTNGVYNVQVTVTDNGIPNLTDVQDIAVTILDVNENPVIISDGGGATASVNAAENQTFVTDVQSVDDSNSEGAGLTYTITGGADAGLFSIGTLSGVVTFNTAPNFENPTDTGANGIYDVQVTVTDSGAPNLTDVQDLAVTVTDTNENPVITSDGGGATASINVDENTTAVTTVTATDEDLPAQTLTFTISGGADQALFGITPGGVLTFNAAPDFENPLDSGGNNVYDVQVTVTDNGLPNLSDVQDIAVTVDDVDPEVSPPDAKDDSFDSLANVGLDAPTMQLFADNGSGADVDGGGILVVTAVNGSGANVGNDTATGDGTVNVASTGAFVYTPDAGFLGTDTFTYTVENGSGSSDTATVSIDVGAFGVIWFIDNADTGANEGTLDDPFQSINDFNSSGLPGTGDVIFVDDGNAAYTTGINLQNGQLLIGEGATASIASIASLSLPTFSKTLPATGGSAPSLTNAAGNGINLAMTNTVRGLDVGNTSGTGITGTSVGTATISEVSITGTGKGIDIATGTLAVNLDEVSSSNAAGIKLSGVSGDFDVTTGTINSGSATAVDISGSPIDLNVTLTSVSSTGAARGINLSSTTGSFTVTGTGAADSGGVIEASVGDNNENNTVGDGIVLTNAQNISLSWIRIEDSGDHGININGVTNFQLKNSVINDDHTHTGADDDEQGILIKNLYGQSLIQDVSFNAINEDGIEVVSDSADDSSTDELTLRRVTFSNHQGANGEHGIDYRPAAGSDTRLLIDDSTFNIDGDGAIGAVLTSSGTGEIIVRGSDFNGQFAFGSGGIEARGAGSGNVKFLIENNNFNDNNGLALFLSSESSSTVNATIQTNTFDNVTAGDSQIPIDIRIDETSNMNLLIDDNTFSHIVDDAIGGKIINVSAQESGDGDVTITNNDFVDQSGTPNFIPTGILVQAGNGAPENSVLNLKIADNSGITDGGFAGFPGFGEAIGVGQTAAAATVNLEVGSASLSDPATTVLATNNPLTSSVAAPAHVTAGTVNVVANGTVTLPTLPTDPTLLVAAGGVGPGATSVCYAHIGDVVSGAIDRLSDLGLSAEAQATLDAARVTVTNLSGGALAQVIGNEVLIDDDAAGWGWFLDGTPEEDSEFGSDLTASPGSDAAGRMDLLTVLMHEFGHVLGVDHSDDPDSLMADELSVGTRKLADVDEFFAALG